MPAPRSLRCLLVGVTLVVLLAGGALDAQEGIPEETAPRWRLTPYLWVPEIAGSTSSDGEEAEGTLTFFDVLQSFGFVGVDAGDERWRLRGDLKFLRLDGEWDRPPETGFELDISALELTAARRVFETRPARAEGPTVDLFAVDLFAGVRLWSARLELEFIGFTVEGTEEWVDPLLGFESSWHHDRWRARVAGDIGGFDVGSKLCWQWIAGVAYECTRTFAVGLDYRVLDIDAPFDDGPDLWRLDLQLRGPQLTFSFEF